MQPRTVDVIGAGPAGSAAAIAARLNGSRVRLFELSRFPRHKVCGEFLSPETVAVLGRLGVWEDVLRAGPSKVTRVALFLGSVEKRASLPRPVFGLSRYRLDEILLDRALSAGVELIRETGRPGGLPTVLASGRNHAPPRGTRLFGFKSHFDGPPGDTVELYFFSGCYVGVSPVEGGGVNVCGLGPESVFRTGRFNPEPVLNTFPPLEARLAALRRRMPWLWVGPLVFRTRFNEKPEKDLYPAGDQLSFVDPFTGSGILSALITGEAAGLAASRALPVADYLAECRRMLHRPFRVSHLLRKSLAAGWAERLAPFVPARLLFEITRPVQRF